MKMWSCFDIISIRERIQLAIEDQLIWTFWQDDEGEVDKYLGKMIGIEGDKVSVALITDPVNKFLRGGPIQGHSDKNDMIFKREKIDIKDDLILFPIPNEMKVKDIRLVERLYYKYQDYKSISFSCYMREKELSLSYIMSDLSTMGISFIAPKKDLIDFKPGMDITISHISDQQLNENIPAKIIYMAAYDEKFFKSESQLGKLTKVGVQFEEGLDEVIFSTVSNVIQTKQKKMLGLDVQGYNGLTQEEIERKIAYISEADPKLGVSIADNIEEIERLRFLTPKMKQVFWTEVNRDILAQALRITSKELLYDLLSDVTENVRMDFLDSLDKQLPAGTIEQSQTIVIKFMREKEQSGEFVLSPDTFVKYV